MSHRDWSALAGAYALGALDAEERAAFESQLAIDPALAAEVRSYEAVTGLLGEAHAPEPPPERLRQRILDRAQGVVPLSQRPMGRPGQGEGPLSRSGSAASDGGLDSRPRESDASQRRLGSGLVPWLAAAAGLVLSLGIWSAYRGADVERVRLLTEIETLRESLALESTSRAERDAILASLLGPEVHSVSLAAAGQAPAARVYWNHTEELFIVTAFDLPPAPQGSTYQLWAIADDQAPVSMGTFDTDGSGTAVLTLPVGQDITNLGLIALCGLTLEPTGGSAQPTEQPRLLGAWRHAD